MTYERQRLTISSKGVGDVFTTLPAMISTISNGKVVMFTPMVLGLSMPTRSNAKRRERVSREKRCQCRGCMRRILSWLVHLSRSE
jgi:hypothetical protein